MPSIEELALIIGVPLALFGALAWRLVALYRNRSSAL